MSATLILSLIANCQSLALYGSTPEQCYCVCGSDNKKCVIAPGSLFDFQYPSNNRACKCDTTTGTCPDGFEFSGKHKLFGDKKI